MAPVSNNGEKRIVTLVRGMMEQGGFYWCYVSVKPNMILQFQRAVANKYNIQNFVKDGYGEVVVSGRGRNPPKDVSDKVSQMFGVTFQSLEDLDESHMDAAIASMLNAMSQAPSASSPQA